MIQPFKQESFGEICKLLIDSHYHDQLNEALVDEKIYNDPDFDPENCLVWEENGTIAGFLLGVIREIRGEKLGYIKLISVLQPYRRKGIANQLLARFEQILKSGGVGKLRIYDVPLNYFMPGVDPRYTPAVCFALKNGFKHLADAVNMEVRLDQDFEVSTEIETVKKHSIEIRRASLTDRDDLLEFIDQPWALWKNEIEMAFKSNPVSIHIALKEGKVMAFSAYEGNNRGTGWFGPMGTHPDLRGLGIGTILLKLCLGDMKRAGYKKSIIPWVGPISFYSHYVNAYISRIFWRFEKQLNE